MLFALSFAVFALAVLGLGIGVLFGRGPPQGSCGGNAVLKTCPLCRSGEDPCPEPSPTSWPPGSSH